MKTFIRCVSFSLLVSMASHAQTALTYVGEATVITVDIFGEPLKVGDTGALPAAGGSLSSSSVSESIPLSEGTIEIIALNASTVGQNNSTQSQASLATVDFSIAGITIGVTGLQASATAQCGSSPSGSAQVVAFSIDGFPVDINGQPNQTITLGPVTLVINEQIVSTDGSTITVNALHIKPSGEDVADLILSSATAGITCSSSL